MRQIIVLFAASVTFVGLLLTAGGTEAGRAEPARLELSGQRVFIPTPKAGVFLKAMPYYTRPTGTDMFCRYVYITRSDTQDTSFEMFSTDNGRTWNKPVEVATGKKVPGGILRAKEVPPGFVDAERGVLIVLPGHSLLETDNPLEAMTNSRINYKLSRDGGHTFYHEAPIIHTGAEYNADHPMPGVWYGKNALQVGDLGSVMIKLKNGDLLQPLQITPIGPDGKYYNPGGGYTYHDCAVMIARWNDQGTLDWTLSERVEGDPKQSSRGMIEPTIVQVPDGRVLMVMRGSNDNVQAPGYRWHSVSADNGRTWSKTAPWKYTNGESFFSPSSCSRLLVHSSGPIVWIGNIAPTNPKGNNPRYPFVAGIVDPESLQLIKESVIEIDTRREGDHPLMTLSNFTAYEDRETGEIVVICSPIGRKHPLGRNNLTGKRDWTADSNEYRIKVVAGKK